jgi:hypothetical protein
MVQRSCRVFGVCGSAAGGYELDAGAWAAWDRGAEEEGGEGGEHFLCCWCGCWVRGGIGGGWIGEVFVRLLLR